MEDIILTKVPETLNCHSCWVMKIAWNISWGSALVDKMLKKVENFLFESDGVRIHWRSNHYTGIYTFTLKYLQSSHSLAFQSQAHSLSLTSFQTMAHLILRFFLPEPTLSVSHGLPAWGVSATPVWGSLTVLSAGSLRLATASCLSLGIFSGCPIWTSSLSWSLFLLLPLAWWRWRLEVEKMVRSWGLMVSLA